MSVKNEISFRKTDMEQDLEFAYRYLFKAGVEHLVKELNGGVWPEEERYNFFKKGFCDPGMMMIMHQGVDVGCFCIAETDEAIILQRVYLLPEYRRQGIGERLIELALEKAHEAGKPLELEVLENNVAAINSYKKAGFQQCSDVMVNGWNRKFTMRHKDTDQYVTTATPVPALVQRQAAQNFKVAI